MTDSTAITRPSLYFPNFYPPRHIAQSAIYFYISLSYIKTPTHVVITPRSSYPMTRETIRSASILAISDIHCDHKLNFNCIKSWQDQNNEDNTLIIAGDISDKIEVLERTFLELKQQFKHIFYVPGNHELWQSDRNKTSKDKLNEILDLCRFADIYTRPRKVEFLDANKPPIWIVPLFSWYIKSHEGPGSLFKKKPVIESGEVQDLTEKLWKDNYLFSWPLDNRDVTTVAEDILLLNHDTLKTSYDAAVISFSHFLPRQDLMFKNPNLAHRYSRFMDPYPEFNFSEVAGCQQIEAQIKKLNSRIHIYGHQHRNRDVLIGNTRYLSHCLGYPQEREKGYLPKTSSYPLLVY